MPALRPAPYSVHSPDTIASATHPYPTYNDGVWNAAIADKRHRLARQPVSGVMSLLAWVRRRVLDRAERDQG